MRNTDIGFDHTSVRSKSPFDQRYEGTLMAKAATRRRSKATPKSRWKTIRFHPDKEYERLNDEGFRYIREKKFNHTDYITLAACLNHGLATGLLDDPDAEEGYNREMTLDVDVDALCNRIHERTKFSRKSLAKNIDRFVELGFFEGLELRGDE